MEKLEYHLQVFDGPLDLLLALSAKNKLDIYDIPIAELLDQYLEAVDLSRDKNVFIGNIVKCRPPENRDPLPEEWDACLPWLREQFKFIRPKIVVCLGRIAAQRLIRPDFSVTKEHGQFEEKNGVLFTATLHPAALLRNPTQKPLAFADYVALREKILEVCDHTY